MVQTEGARQLQRDVRSETRKESETRKVRLSQGEREGVQKERERERDGNRVK